MGICEICGREMESTFHHYIPVTLHSNKKFKKLYEKEYLKTHGINLCKTCHKMAEAFTYDDDTDVFYRLTGDINGVTTDNNNFKRHKEPKIIFSEADPYGEEDWDE